MQYDGGSSLLSFVHINLITVIILQATKSKANVKMSGKSNVSEADQSILLLISKMVTNTLRKTRQEGSREKALPFTCLNILLSQESLNYSYEI